MPDSPLIVRYRPQSFDEVVGHAEILSALQRAMAEPSHAHAYLLTGASGVGKTTIARLIAAYFNAEVNEVDAATYSGVDAMRQLIADSAYQALNGSGRRMYIINEAQRLSRGAFDALLTTLEEPPDHLFFALTTTEFDKVPKAILTRSYHIRLDSLREDDLSDLIAAVAGAEDWKVDNDVHEAIIQAAGGSPRQALSILQQVHDVKSRDEVARIIRLQDAGDPLRLLCQLMLNTDARSKWSEALRLLALINSDDFETASIAASRYVMAAMTGSKNEAKARHAWGLLEAMVFPAATFDRKAAFYAAVGRILWSGGDVV